MGDTLHIIPVGFDFERLIQPISQGGLQADRVLLLRADGDEEDDGAAELANQMYDKLHEDFDRVLGADVERRSIENIYDYSELYAFAFELFQEELEQGAEVYVNISSMPRTVAFAFATAADALIIETPEYRDLLHTYYVSPENYAVLDLLDILRDELEFLERKQSEIDDQEFSDRISEVEDGIEDVMEGGVTEGAKEMEDGNPYVEFPAPPVAEVSDIQKQILYYLNDSEPVDSISKVAKGHAGTFDLDYSDSHRSKVKYNIDKLEESGYIRLVESGNSHQVELTKMGRLWVDTHERTGESGSS